MAVLRCQVQRRVPIMVLCIKLEDVLAAGYQYVHALVTKSDCQDQRAITIFITCIERRPSIEQHCQSRGMIVKARIVCGPAPVGIR